MRHCGLTGACVMGGFLGMSLIMAIMAKVKQYHEKHVGG